MRKNLFAIFSFVIILIITTLTLSSQNFIANPDKRLDELKGSNHVFLLQTWDARVLFCESFFPRKCKVIRKIDNIEVPSNQLNQIISSKPQGNLLSLKLKINPDIKAFIESKGRVSLVVPDQSAQRSMLVNPYQESREGHYIDAGYTITARMLEKAEELQIDFDYRKFPIAGPTDLSIALVDLAKVHSYTEILELRDVEAKLTRFYETALPTVLASIALVLDHSDGFSALMPFAVLKGIRTFFYDLESRQDLLWLFFLLNSLYFPLLVFATQKIVQIRYSKNRIYIAAGLGVLIQSALVYKANYLIYSDIVTDLIAAILALIIIATSLKFDIKDRELSSKKQLVPALVLTLLGLISSIIANTGDIYFLAFSGSKDFSNILHYSLVPFLVAASLFGMGSVKSYLKILRRKAAEEKENETAMIFLKSLLPERKYRKGDFSWRAVHHPATKFAGDTYGIYPFDIDGKEYLAFCLIDITGHGLTSALMVPSALSGFKRWAENCEVELKLSPKEQVVSEAPRIVQHMLSNDSSSLGGSAVFGLIDLDKNEYTYSLAGHHASILSEPSEEKPKNRTLFKRGSSRLGPTVDDENLTWESFTEKLPDGPWQIMVFTDGVADIDTSIGRWLNSIVKKTPFESLARKFVEEIRSNKSKLRKLSLENKLQTEDDMTILIFSRNT